MTLYNKSISNSIQRSRTQLVYEYFLPAIVPIFVDFNIFDKFKAFRDVFENTSTIKLIIAYLVPSSSVFNGAISTFAVSGMLGIDNMSSPILSNMAFLWITSAVISGCNGIVAICGPRTFSVGKCWPPSMPMFDLSEADSY